MKFDPRIHHHRSIRLSGYDYSQPGAYFVTIVTHGRESMFGEIENGEMRLNEAGRIVRRAWDDLPRHYPHVELGTFCIMPNHIHGIIILTDDGCRGGSASVDAGLQNIPPGSRNPSARPSETHPYDTPNHAGTHSQTRPYDTPNHAGTHSQTRPYKYKRHALPEIVRAFKSFLAKRVNAMRGTEGIPVWQRNYYEHIIRDDDEHNRIHLYIESNPLCWAEDDENPGGDP